MPIVSTSTSRGGRTTVTGPYQNWQDVHSIPIPTTGHVYVCIAVGVLGAFAGQVSNGLPGEVKCSVTDANGSVTQESFTPLHQVHQGHSLMGASGRRGIPFCMVFSFTAAAGDAFVRIYAHSGDAATGMISDLGLWLWDRDNLPSNTAFASVNTIPPIASIYPTFTTHVSVATPANSAGVNDVWFVAWSCETFFPDVQYGYHTRLRRLEDTAVLMGEGNAATDHYGIGSLGLLSGSDRFVMGGFRTFTGVPTSTARTLEVQFATPNHGAPGSPPRPQKATVFVARLGQHPALPVMDDQHSLYTTNLTTFTGASGPGTPSIMAFIPNSPVAITPYHIAASAGLPCTTTIPGSARLEMSLDGNYARIGQDGLYSLGWPGQPAFSVTPYPQQSLILGLPNPGLGNTTHTLSLVGAGNASEFGQGVRRGYDVAHTVCSFGTQLIIAAPVLDTAGPDVYLRVGREAPRLSAIAVIDHSASYVEDLEVEYRSTEARMDDGHTAGWSHDIVGSKRRRLHWDAVKLAEWLLTIKPVIESGDAFQLRVDGESTPRVFRSVGSRSAHELIAGNQEVDSYAVSADVVELVLLGP